MNLSYVLLNLGGHDITTAEFSLALLVIFSTIMLLGSRIDSFRAYADVGADVSHGLRREQALGSSNSLESIIQEADTRALNPLDFRPFTVISVDKVSYNTALVRFKIPGDRDLGLAIGRHVSVRAEINGIKVIRPYTPTSRPDTKGHFDLLIKKYTDGKMSSHIHNLCVGDTLEFRGPVGRFKYTMNQYKKMGLIAAGSGLTPCLQVIRSVLEGPSGDDTKFVLFFQNRTEQDILLKDELQMLAKTYSSRLKVFFFLSSPTNPDWGIDFARGKGFKSFLASSPRTGAGKIPEVRGAINSIALQEAMSPSECELIGMCGPSGFNDAMKNLLTNLGHTDNSLYVW